LFDPYGVGDPEMFLSSLRHKDGRSQSVVTLKMDPESEATIMLSMSGDYKTTQKSFVKDMKLGQQGEDGWSWWSTADGDTKVLFEGGSIVLGEREELQKFELRRYVHNADSIKRLADSDAPIATLGTDHSSSASIVEILANEGHGDTVSESTYFTETRFTKAGIERKTTSDFGLIGSIIAQLAGE
jgi:hypothetical protein